MNTYEYRKMQQKCTACGKRDAYTIAGHSLCYECNEENNRQCRENYRKNPAKKAKSQKERLDALRDAGICITCRTRPVDDPTKFTRCPVCRARALANYNKRKKRQSRDTANQCGLCFKCLQPLDDPSAKMCSKCASKCDESLKSARSVEGHNEAFRALNEAGWRERKEKNNGGKCMRIL